MKQILQIDANSLGKPSVLRPMRIITMLISGLFLLCFEVVSAGMKIEGRWYTNTQLESGQKVFLNNCAVCHGKQAQGLTEDWRKLSADGTYPAPPLNGTAHAWHHPLSQLRNSVREGGVRLGGKMPGFKTKLSDEDQLAAIAYFQSFWAEELYMQWAQRGGATN